MHMLAFNFNKKDSTVDVVLGMNWIYWNKYFVNTYSRLLIKLFSLSQRLLWHVILLTGALHVQFRQSTLKSILFAMPSVKTWASKWLVKNCWKVKLLKRSFKNYKSGHGKVPLKIDIQEILKTMTLLTI